MKKMTSGTDIILKSWLRTLRYNVEYYEDTFESGNNRSEYNRSAKIMMIDSVNSGDSDSGDEQYLNIWDCSNEGASKINSLESVGTVSELSNVESECSGSYSSSSIISAKKIRKKPVATPRLSKSLEKNEAIYVNLPVKYPRRTSESNFIYENLPPKFKSTSESEPIYENLPMASSNDSLKYEEEVFSTIQYLEDVIESIDTCSEEDDYSKYSTINSDYIEELKDKLINDKTISGSTSSFEDFLSEDQLRSKTDADTYKLKRVCALFEELEPALPQEIKNIPLQTNNFDIRKRYSMPLKFTDIIENTWRPQSLRVELKQQTCMNSSELTLCPSSDLNLSFAKESRISSIFEEGVVEELEILEPLVENVEKKQEFVESLREDIVNWMAFLMKDYCGEFENIMEEKELLKSINQVPKDPQERLTENKFPLDADDVEIRRKPEFRTNRISKTTDFDAGRRRQTIPVNPKNFEIRGILKIEFLSNISLIKLKEEYIAYENENLFRVNDKSRTKELLASNIIIKSVRYPKSKESKEVELKDTKDVIYLLHFQELKYAKQFMENEKVQVYITDNKVTIKKTLLRFLGKRSSREILEKKGIYKNEPIFGNTLRDIYNKSITNSLVPTFIIEVIKLLEKPENIKSLGVYRTSGNLAIIQKIRFEVDNGRLSILGQYAKDPDVLTGSLKLFFRELKEPLIQREVCDKLLEYISAKDPKQMLSKDHQKIRSILVKNLHEANLETFVVIINHLLEVIKYKEINKMDAYNLAICWGPSMIFSIQGAPISAISDISKDIVAQSHDATRMVDFFLNYYQLFPAELLTLGKRSRPESISEKVYLLKRQESKDSVGSSDSSKTQKKSASSLSLSVDDITKKLIESIEPHLDNEGLYRKLGSADKTNKIMKKLTKKKINELEKYKNDVYELAEALKKYLKEQDCLVYEDTVELVLRVAPDSSQSCLEPTTRQKVISLIEDTPKKDTLIFLLQHLAKTLEIQENKYQVPRYELVGIWANVLNNPKKTKRSNEDFARFLDVAIKVFNDNLPDIVRSSVNNNGCSPVRNRSMDELMKEMKHQQAERDRNSRYDNVDSDVGEASILEDKTEQTKL
ncbi:unnamed protein product [Ceutorhynchus assimilis]|uniref:Rho-GAP domain-containing protein n=1 Tax=Ceutorhynchus assimilis TaxID=467358 RepID=A0A9N9QQW2_9CUCU|nr:unnamed protein product [Ceutorhynchus assimilis]